MSEKEINAPYQPAVYSLGNQARMLVILSVLLIAAFARPLVDLFGYALRSELFSHILLVPFISAYLIVLKRAGLRAGTSPDRKWGTIALAAALCVLLGYWVALQSGAVLGRVEYLSWTILGFFLLLVAACCFSLGRETIRTLAFPIGFLAFIVPFPDWLTVRIETFLQYASAMAAQAMFGLTGMPVVREGLKFLLPGMCLEVAPECSGIHSTLVLFITSLLAGQLFLRSQWTRAILCLAVIPLGILRNAVRICTIGQLCVHIGPQMIDSPIHRRGGPVFFVASLVPFFLLLWFLRRTAIETRLWAQPKVQS
jgi:exosortase C (VPDSG-CTERM-specific)